MKKTWMIPVDFGKLSRRQLAAKLSLLKGEKWKKLSVSEQEERTRDVNIKHSLDEVCEDKMCPYCAMMHGQKVKVKTARQDASPPKPSGGEDGSKQEKEKEFPAPDGAAKP